MKPIPPNMNARIKDAQIKRELDTVDPAAALQMRSSNPNRELMMLRAQFPFVQIMPPPTIVVAKVLNPANTAVNIQVPDNASIVRFFADGDFFASFGANATIPTLALQDQLDMLTNPLLAYFYVKDKQQISVISATNNRFVSAAFWSFNFTDEGVEGF